MKRFRGIIRFFMVIFPIIWIYEIQKCSDSKIFLGLGGVLSSLYFLSQSMRNEKKIKKAMFQHIKTKLDNDMVFLSVPETVQLGSLMKHFTKQQKGRMQTSNNNPDGLSLYKVSEPMKDKLVSNSVSS